MRLSDVIKEQDCQDDNEELTFITEMCHSAAQKHIIGYIKIGCQFLLN